MLVLNNLVADADVAGIRDALNDASFVDGRATQALFIVGKKSNRQADFDDPVTVDLTARVKAALTGNLAFRNYARPHRWSKLKFARYGVGDAYDMHVDHPVMAGPEGNLRSDLSFTLFLSDPAEYQGGELLMHGMSDQHVIKLPRGSVVIYPTTVPHRVAPVTKGERLVCVGWVQSLVRREDQREILFDLAKLRQALPSGEARLTLEKSIFNLIRLWADS